MAEEHPSHPEVSPPGTPEHPETPPPGSPTHPDVPPPVGPSHPDVPPPVGPSHPIEEHEEGEQPEHPIEEPGDEPHPEPQAAMVEPRLGFDSFLVTVPQMAGMSQAVRAAASAALKSWMRGHRHDPAGYYTPQEWQEHYASAMAST